MGLLYRLVCKDCGYKTKDLLDGPAPDGVPPTIGLCRTCKRVAQYVPGRDKPVCRKCRKELEPVYSLEMVPCPRCPATMKFISVGIWD